MGPSAKKRPWRAAAGVAAALPMFAVFATTSQNKPNSTWSAAFGPFFAKYCAGCHGQGATTALRFDVLKDPALAVVRRERIEKIVEMVKLKVMPPAGMAQPTDADRQSLIRAAQQLFSGAPPVSDPGRVTMRRLNRAEYDNTVRDLLGIDFKASADFPNDDVGYGFDNIGDVLSLSPLLFEKYLDAAEKAAAMAIVLPESRTVRFPASQLDTDKGNPTARDGSLGLFAASYGAVTFNAPRPGPYRLRIHAWAQNAGPEAAKMSVRLGDRELQVFEVRAREASPQLFELPLDLQQGSNRISAHFVNDYYNPQDPIPANRDRNLFLKSFEIVGPLNASQPKPKSHSMLIRVDPDPKDPLAAARANLKPFLNRAFRRPVPDPTVDRYVKLVETALKDGETFEEGMRVAVAAVLVSPQFLFRVELDGSRKASRTAPLDDYELASRLSYFLWSSMPDAELFALAEAGKLRDPATLKLQALRMLKDPKSWALTENFASQWLTLRKLEDVSPDPELFPGFDRALGRAMRAETERFFSEVVKSDSSVILFLDAPFTYLNERLARHYGIAGVTGDALRKVEVRIPARGGLLTMASVLTVTSNPNRTSPVKRGKWVLENILGEPPPPPPPGLDALEGDQDKTPAKTIKERMAKHRSDPTCAVCHVKMDPLGIAFENYDPVGRWRNMDGKFKVDATGQTAEGERFKDASDLKKILLKRKSVFVRALAEKLMTFGLGRGVQSSDRQSLDAIAAQSAKEGYRFSSLVKGIVASDAFRKKRID